jgi:uncharacterized membrane protein YczE
MKSNHLRLAYVAEFLIAVMAIFTAWSEVGGQSVLDAMPWGWKLGLGLSLAWALVAYTAALVGQDQIWTKSAIKWLTAVVLLITAMGLVTWYYVLQLENTDSTEESEGSSLTSDLRSMEICQARPVTLWIRPDER